MQTICCLVARYAEWPPCHWRTDYSVRVAARLCYPRWSKNRSRCELVGVVCNHVLLKVPFLPQLNREWNAASDYFTGCFSASTEKVKLVFTNAGSAGAAIVDGCIRVERSVRRSTAGNLLVHLAPGIYDNLRERDNDSNPISSPLPHHPLDVARIVPASFSMSSLVFILFLKNNSATPMLSPRIAPRSLVWYLRRERDVPLYA